MRNFILARGDHETGRILPPLEMRDLRMLLASQVMRSLARGRAAERGRTLEQPGGNPVENQVTRRVDVEKSLGWVRQIMVMDRWYWERT